MKRDTGNTPLLSPIRQPDRLSEARAANLNHDPRRNDVFQSWVSAQERIVARLNAFRYAIVIRCQGLFGRTVQIPVWVALLLAIVLVTAPTVTLITQSNSAGESVPPSPTADSSQINQALENEEVSSDVVHPGTQPAYDPEATWPDIEVEWKDPDPSGISKRQIFLMEQGVDPGYQEVRYAAEEVERLQAELEAIQRNSALLRSLTRQQSGDLSAAYSSLEATQEQKDGAIDDLERRIEDLAGQVETIDGLARELRDILGLPENDSGVGGPIATTKPDEAEADPWLTLRANIVAIEQRAGSLVLDLDEVNTEIQLRVARVQQAPVPDGGSVRADVQFHDSMPVGWPVQGPITSRFGLRGNPFGPGQHMHTGIDIAARTGTPVLATGGGTVQVSGDGGGYGLLVVIDHGRGVTSWYGHNSRLLVSPGQRVSAGDVIAEVGSTGMSTGPHVHYEVRHSGVPQDPLPMMQMQR